MLNWSLDKSRSIYSDEGTLDLRVFAGKLRAVFIEFHLHNKEMNKS